jgi:hypothetical protein
MSTRLRITRQAAIQRINRHLKKEDRVLRKNRRESDSTLGEYFIVDLRRNVIWDKDADVEEVGREIGALKPYEKIED